MSQDDEQQQDSVREDPTLASSSEPTQSIAQSTPPTQAFPQWSPPYPEPPTAPAAPAEPSPPPAAAHPSPPPAAYPYAGAEPTPTTAPPPVTPPSYVHPQQVQPQYVQPQYVHPQQVQQQHSAPTYGPPSHGAPPPPAALPPYGIPGVAYAPPQQTNASALVLTIISGILTVSCYFTLVGIPSLIIGIVALTKQNTDIAGSRRLSRIGWITFAAVGILYVLVIAGFITLAVLSDSSSSSSSSSYEY